MDVGPLSRTLLWSLVLCSLTGCSNLAERLGLRVRLDKLAITSVSASLANSRGGRQIQALGPGQSAALVITARTEDGQEFSTVAAGKGKVALDNYRIEATVVTLKRGTVSLSSDPRVSEGKTGQLHIVPTAHPELAADLDIPVRYDIPFTVDYSGADGSNGMDGTDGMDGLAGTDGTPATVDPTTGALGTAGPGGVGTDGSNGGNGSNGQDGWPGRDLTVWIRLESAEKPLLQIKVVAAHAGQSLYLVDPHGGSVKLSTNGGSGGRGGQGGSGGSGGRGGTGFPPGLDGHSGLRGQDGRAGNAGSGGMITISVDPAAEPFLSCITWANPSGGGGRPGTPPKINVEPVEPLW